MRSPVWEYFEKTPDKIHAKCKVCQKLVVRSNTTTNLFTHLKAHHPDVQIVKDSSKRGVDEVSPEGQESEPKAKQPRTIPEMFRQTQAFKG